MPDGFVLEIPEMVGIPLAAKRQAQAASRAWPEGTVIVSADSHMIERDCWYERFPRRLRSKAPRIELKEGGYRLLRRRRADDPGRACRLPLPGDGVRIRGMSNVQGPAEGLSTLKASRRS